MVEVSHTAKTAQHVRLLEISDRCPVHRTLTESAIVETERLPDDKPDAGAENCVDGHGLMMQQVCAEADQTGDDR